MKKIFIVSILILLSGLAAVAQEIIGPTYVGANVSEVYRFTITNVALTNVSWTESSGSALMDWTVSNNTSYLDISWPTQVGSVTLSFYYNGSSTPVTKRVVVGCATEPSYTIGNAVCNGGYTIAASPGSGGNTVRWYTNASGGTPFNTGLSYTTAFSTSTLTYYISTYKSGCETGRIRVDVPPSAVVPSLPTTNTSPQVCSGTVTLHATPGSNADVARWTNAAGTLLYQGNDYMINNLTANSTVYVASYQTATGCSSARVTVNTQVNITPSTPIGSSTTVRAEGQVYLTASTDRGANPVPRQDEDQLLWYTVPEGGTPEGVVNYYEAYATPVLNAPITYYVSLRDGVNGCASKRNPIVAGVLPPISPARVRSEQARVPGIQDESQWSALTDVQKQVTTQYFDGLLRLNQQIAVKASPDGRDIVQPAEFDKNGHAVKQYLPYVSSSTDGLFQTNYSTAQASFYNTSGDDIADDTTPYARSVYEESPTGRLLEQGGVGADFQPGTGHTMRSAFVFNGANEVRKFNSDGSSTGFYAANTLNKTTVTDPNGHQNIQFINEEGSLVLEKRQWDESVGGVAVDYLETYYVYDDMGRIRYIISPKGVAALKAGSWALTQNIKDGYAHQFVYDALARLIEKKVPGQAWMYYGYDRMDRLVLVQDGLCRAQNKWRFTKYDVLNRPVLQGWYTNTTYTTRAAIQQNVLDGLYVNENDSWYESPGTALQGYTNVSFPTTNVEAEVVNYFDSYDLDRNGADDFGYTVQGLAGEGRSVIAQGLPTATKRVIPGTSPAVWLGTYMFYDEYGRMIQSRSNNHLNPTVYNDLSTQIYNFDGLLIASLRYHDAGAGRIATVENQYVYDANGRLAEVRQKNNAAATFQVVARYVYNALGQLVDKKLHQDAGTGKYLQSVDFRYSISGQLLSINNATLTSGTNNTDTDAVDSDYFGMEFLYQQTEAALGNTPLYNGNISAVKWKGPETATGTQGQRSYKFSYDKVDQMKQAQYGVNDGTGWGAEINALNETLTYDQNGNILSLQRNQRVATGGAGLYGAETIDNLTYSYQSDIGDRLAKVQDASGNPLGFADQQQGEIEYRYDVNGNLLADDNKGINTITYTLLGKPSVVTFTDGRRAEYVYDAAGIKLTTKQYAAGSTTPKVTDYCSGFVYDDAALSFFGSPEGRVVMKGTAAEYQYALTDHQGNTRVVFTSATPETESFSTTFEESSNQTLEQYPSGANRSAFTLFNHTENGGSHSQLLSGAQNAQVGVARSFAVVPGDEISIEAYAKYYNAQSSVKNDVTAFASALLSAFGAPASAAGELRTASAGLEAYGNIVASGDGADDDTGHPKAFVNILLFDRQQNLLDIAYQQIDGGEQTGTTATAHDYMAAAYTVKEAGYAYVYVSNENPTYVEVYFDDVTITHTPSRIVQYNEYYAFGLQANTSWTREDSKNNFLYNGGSELNAEVGWYETFFRGYDPTLGRFLQIDPRALESHTRSVYNFANNNPAVFSDPMGDKPSPFKPTPPPRDDIRVSYYSVHERIGPGTENYWSNGIGTTGWSLDGGSDVFREGYWYSQRNAGAQFRNGQWVDAKGIPLRFKDVTYGYWEAYNYTDEDGAVVSYRYVTKTISVGAGNTQQNGVVLDVNGNVMTWGTEANNIYVNINGENVRFHDRLVKSGKMNVDAFGNGLLNIVRGIKSKRFVFDESRLYNGKFSVAFTSDDGKDVFSSNGGIPGGISTGMRRAPDGSFLITYYHINGILTVDALRSQLGVHEYYGHAIQRLDDSLGNEATIKMWVNEYLSDPNR